MDKKFIKGVAKIYYKENVEGEPLDQDTPIECFIAGAEFILKSKKIHAKVCNISDYSSYNLKNSNMSDDKKMAKILENVEKIETVTGFYITAPGDPSVGINPATWKLENDFYFDRPEELEEFKKELRSLFEFYCGEVTDIITFEEQEAQCEAEDRAYYEEFPVRFLIKDGGNFKKAGSTASYVSSAAEGIHTELPHWMSEKGYNGHNTTIIKSTEPEFRQILLDEARQLESSINNDEYSLRLSKNRLRLIQQKLKHGK